MIKKELLVNLLQHYGADFFSRCAGYKSATRLYLNGNNLSPIYRVTLLSFDFKSLSYLAHKEGDTKNKFIVSIFDLWNFS